MKKPESCKDSSAKNNHLVRGSGSNKKATSTRSIKVLMARPIRDSFPYFVMYFSMIIYILHVSVHHVERSKHRMFS